MYMWLLIRNQIQIKGFTWHFHHCPWCSYGSILFIKIGSIIKMEVLMQWNCWSQAVQHTILRMCTWHVLHASLDLHHLRRVLCPAQTCTSALQHLELSTPLLSPSLLSIHPAMAEESVLAMTLHSQLTHVSLMFAMPFTDRMVHMCILCISSYRPMQWVLL